MRHIVTLKSAELKGWDGNGEMIFLINRERHFFELNVFEKIVRLMKLPLVEFGGYDYGPYFHIKTAQWTLPTYDAEIQNGDTVDVELELSEDTYFKRIKMTVTNIRFVRR